MASASSGVASSAPKKGKKVLGMVVGGVGLAGFAVVGYWSYTHPTVRMLNAGSAATVSVFVDDVQVATDVKKTNNEEEARSNYASTNVATGEHTFTAKDESGKVIDTQKVTIEGGETYLYAPAHSNTVCFTLQTDSYGDVSVASPMQALDPSKSFWKLPSSPDYWFEDTPDSVNVDSKSKGTTKSTLRAHPCGDSDFEP